MSSWHNRLGENGQRLTILSVLPRDPSVDEALRAANELSLRQAIDELFRIAGEDGRADVLMLSASEGADHLDTVIEEQISLRDLADRLYAAFGEDGLARSALRVLGPDDDPLALLGMSEESSADDDKDSGPLAAIRRFREAVYRLFGGSAEQGVPPTVLSLLVDHPAAPEEESADDA